MGVSLIGTWMQTIGQTWFVYKLTNSAFLTGIVGMLQFAPVLIFSLFAGVFIDRLPKKKVLIVTQTALMLLAFALAGLVWSGRAQYWHILIIASLLGLVTTVDGPAKMTYMIELVGRKDLMNAIALNSAVFNCARIIGPAIAGVLMGYMGIAFCFLVNGISFIPVILSLTRIKITYEAKIEKPRANILHEIKEGLLYALKSRILIMTLISASIIGAFAINFTVLVPVFTKEVLHLEEAGFGLLMSCLGVGSLLGSLLIASTSKYGPKRIVLLASPIAISVFLILIGFSNYYMVTGFFLALAGFFVVVFNSTVNSTLQLNTSDEYRGRVMSLYMLAFMGVTPFGNLFVGSIAEQFGSKIAFISCGLMILILLLIINLFIKVKMGTGLRSTYGENKIYNKDDALFLKSDKKDLF